MAWRREVTQIRIRRVLRVSFGAGAAAFLLLLAPLTEAQPLRSPVRLALAPSGKLLVSDYRQQMIFTLDRRDLEILRAFSVPGRPLAIAWGRGRLYVGNESTGSIEVYDPAGKWRYDLGDGEGTVKQPTDIAIDTSRGLVFVVDGQEEIIKVFGINGPLLYTIPRSATDPGQLANPTGIALDEDREEVLVSDYGDPSGYFRARIPPQVQIYNYDGTYLGGISGERRADGYQFSRPQGLAVDGLGHIFVVDSLLGQVLVFDEDTGAGVKTLGSFGSNAGQLLLPFDIVIDDSSKDVFVTNNRRARVEVFRGGGLLP